ncbi:MAG: histidine kinase [Clostridia bacterium]|nr:histidine kinase [Clostridia bacterium]
MGTVNGTLALFCAVCTLVLVFGLQYQQRIRHTKDGGIFHWMLLAAFFALAFDGFGWLFFSQKPGLFRLFGTISVLAVSVLLAIYSDYVMSLLKLNSLLQRRIKPINYALCGFLALLWVLNAIRPFFYDFQTLKFFHPFGTVLVAICTAVVFFDTLFLICINRQKVGKEQFIIMAGLPVLPVISYLPNLWSSQLHLLFPMIFFVLLANYVRLFNLQYSSLSTQREKLHSMQIRSTTERMKPHYIYNVLSSIYYLCETDPAVAQQAVGAFSDYLRSVLEDLDAGGLIPFRRELQTIKSYLSLEKMRFGDRFRVSFQIEADRFLLPPFSVQPVVENAVKHGVENSDLVGEIRIESFETPSHFVVVVSDNCGGFDVEQLRQDKGSFGLRYIQQILSMTVNGKIVIESEVGVGTSVTIRIPKEEVAFLQPGS